MLKNKYIGEILEEYIVKIMDKRGNIVSETVLECCESTKEAVKCYNETCAESTDGEIVQLVHSVKAESFDETESSQSTYNVLATFHSAIKDR